MLKALVPAAVKVLVEEFRKSSPKSPHAVERVKSEPLFTPEQAARWKRHQEMRAQRREHEQRAHVPTAAELDSNEEEIERLEANLRHLRERHGQK